MVILQKSLSAWNSASFTQALSSEIQSLRSGDLPLEKGSDQGGLVDDSDLGVTVLGLTDDEDSIQAKVGIFYKEIVGGCSCGDEPMVNNAYCELQVVIDKSTARAEIVVLSG